MQPAPENSDLNRELAKQLRDIGVDPGIAFNRMSALELTDFGIESPSEEAVTLFAAALGALKHKDFEVARDLIEPLRDELLKPFSNFGQGIREHLAKAEIGEFSTAVSNFHNIYKVNDSGRELTSVDVFVDKVKQAVCETIDTEVRSAVRDFCRGDKPDADVSTSDAIRLTERLRTCNTPYYDRAVAARMLKHRESDFTVKSLVKALKGWFEHSSETPAERTLVREAAYYSLSHRIKHNHEAMVAVTEYLVGRENPPAES